MARTTFPTRRIATPKRLLYRAGPWHGQRTTIATATDRPKYAELLRNFWIRDPDVAPIAVGRPGFDLAGAGGTIPLGSAGKRTCQYLGQFTEPDGTEHRVAIVGGQFYEYNFGTDAFTETISAANFATATITVSNSARFYAVPFAGEMVFSDGVNAPWSWDGTAGAAGLTAWTNAPVLYGQPWVYNGQLFGIKGTSTSTRISITWSEVGTANVGFEATVGGKTYLNVWDVAQTSQAIFYAGAATNEAMVLCRANSATRIMGATADDFQSTTNLEGVHEFVGTVSPQGLLVHQDVVYYFTNDGRIMKVAPGAPADEIAPGVREYMSLQDTSNFDVVDAQVWDAGAFGEYLLWAVANGASTVPNSVLVVDPRTGELVGVWDGWMQDRMGTWKNANGDPVLVHGGGSTGTTSAEGYVYVHGQPEGSVLVDGFQAADAAIAHLLTTHTMGWDEVTEKVWDIADLSVLVPSDISGITIAPTTPFGSLTSLVTESVTAGTARFGTAIFGTAKFSASSAERKLSVGLDAVGRSCQLDLSHDTSGERIELQSVVVRAYPITDNPGTA